MKRETLGQKAANSIARFGGSWYFIIFFFAFIACWLVGNRCLGSHAIPLDSYFLLNLILSCLGCTQAPIIMMSQNRIEQKDRELAENDYRINLKAELEIRLLHDKIDQLMKAVNTSMRTHELS